MKLKKLIKNLLPHGYVQQRQNKIATRARGGVKNSYFLNFSPPENIKEYRIVGVTPAGRKRYLEILVPHLLAQRPYLSQHIFWLNTTNEQDITYIKNVCRKYPDFLSYLESRVPVDGNK